MATIKNGLLPKSKPQALPKSKQALRSVGTEGGPDA